MGKKIIVTSGPTNERIDSVMKITNMSTGSVGAHVAEKLLTSPDVEKLYYISSKLAKKPVQFPTDSQRLQLIEVESTQDLLNTLGCLLRDPTNHIDAVVHAAAVGDYKARYTARAENIAAEIAKIYDETGSISYAQILSVLTHPACVQDDSTKMSSYEANLMTMMDLTPKVIGSIKPASPDTMLIGFKLLDKVSKKELFDVADRLRVKNNADYIVANDLSKIDGDKHWGMIIGENGVVTECQTKTEIADAIANLIMSEA